MAWKIILRLGALASLALGIAHTFPAGPAEGKTIYVNQRDSCGSATEAEEKRAGVPRHLLSAISLAETGRYDPVSKAKFAWPWTVTSGGPGKYFDTKAEAIQEVQRLRAAGRTNIDVGCMQINLHYHPTAFASLQEAFEPANNVGYASRFLTALKRQTGSWVDAAAHYHSSNPVRNQGYRKKVLAFWESIRGKPVGASHQLVEDVDPQNNSQLVALQERALQMRFRARLATERRIDGRDKRQKQLDHWRLTRGDPKLLAHDAAKRKAELNRRLSAKPKRSPEAFAAKRRAQLAKWRQTQRFHRAATPQRELPESVQKALHGGSNPLIGPSIPDLGALK